MRAHHGVASVRLAMVLGLALALAMASSACAGASATREGQCAPAAQALDARLVGPDAGLRVTPAAASSSPLVVAIPYDLPRAEDIGPALVDLPSGATGQPMAAVLLVSIPASGVWSVDGKPLSSDEALVRVAREAFARDGSVRAVVNADRGAPWGQVLRAIDLLKQGGIAKLAFAVSPVAPAPDGPAPSAADSGGSMARGCPAMQLALCSGAAQFLAGCALKGGAPAGAIEKQLVRSVAARLGPCLSAAHADDAHCADELRRCVREAVLRAPTAAAREEATCKRLTAACAKAGTTANYTLEQCEKVLAATAPAARGQVEAALGPQSPEPAPCNISYIWPPMPFTPYFP